MNGVRNTKENFQEAIAGETHEFKKVFGDDRNGQDRGSKGGREILALQIRWCDRCRTLPKTSA
jgi:hypothetical protein